MNKTGYFTHPDCWKHEMGAGHPECPERLSAIEDRLLVSGVGDALDRREAPPAAIADLEVRCRQAGDALAEAQRVGDVAVGDAGDVVGSQRLDRHVAADPVAMLTAGQAAIVEVPS